MNAKQTNAGKGENVQRPTLNVERSTLNLQRERQVFAQASSATSISELSTLKVGS